MICPRCSLQLPDSAKFCVSCGCNVDADARAARRQQGRDAVELIASLQRELGAEITVERELARGAMGIVFLGRDTRLHRRVAIKVLPPDIASGRSDLPERFLREARIAARLHHPHIVPLYRVAPGNRLLWFVMKFVEGESLQSYIERSSPLPVRKTVSLVSDIAAALHHAHEAGVVHRDVKPANAILDEKERPVVTDFGIASALDDDTLTLPGTIMGTALYMSPEQCEGRRVDHKADQYSLGIISYEMLSGHVPFADDRLSEIFRKHIMDPVPPLSVLQPVVSLPVQGVIERALAKRPEDRWPSTATFAAALRRAAATSSSSPRVAVADVPYLISLPDTLPPILRVAPPEESQATIASLNNRYVPMRPLMTSGHAEFVVARDNASSPGADAHVVIKRLRADAKPLQLWLDRFLNESRLLTGLSHPNVIAVSDTGVSQFGPPLPFHVSRRRSSTPLPALLAADGPLDSSRARSVLIPLFDAVSYLHQNGIIHRDLQPAHVIVDDSLAPTLCDFSMVLRAGEEVGQLWNDDGITRDPHYISPEDAAADPIDARCDLFGLGILVYECVTGRKPFSGRSPLETLSLILREKHEDPSRYNDELGADFDRFMRRMLAKSPGDRFADARVAKSVFLQALS